MRAADGILLGSPVYSADISAKMKAFLERAGVVRLAKSSASHCEAGLFRLRPKPAKRALAVPCGGNQACFMRSISSTRLRA